MRLGALLLFSLVISFVLGGSAQSPGGDGGELGKIIPREMFEDLLKYKDDDRCHAIGFYTYDAFIEAAQAFPAFGNTGNETIRKKEVAAFFAQTAHETNGFWDTAPPGTEFSWGYCYKNTTNAQGDYCNDVYPCPLRGKYYGRGPIQLTGNYNYLRFGEDLGLGYKFLYNPDLLLTDPVVSFQSAIWFWMTPQPPKPSCHEVIIDKWRPSETEENAGLLPGYGLTTNIIAGATECGQGFNKEVDNRIGFFTNFADKFETQPGHNLDCYNQQPYGPNLMAQSM